MRVAIIATCIATPSGISCSFCAAPMRSRRKQQLIKLFSASSLVGQLCGGAFLAAQVLVDHRHSEEQTLLWSGPRTTHSSQREN